MNLAKAFLITAVVAALGVSVLSVYVSLSTATAATVQTKLLTYENPDFHFKIQYPANWTKQEAGLPSHGIVVFYSGNTSSSAQFQVAVFPLSSHNETSDSLAMGMRDNPDSNINYLNASVGIPLAGTRASQVLYYMFIQPQLFSFSSKSSNMKILETFLVKGNTEYALLYGIDPPYFQKYLPLARAMINSFKFTK